MHAEIFISQVSGERIRVGCLCSERDDHEPLIAPFSRGDTRVAAQRTAAR